MFQSFLFSLKKRFIKFFSRNNIFNSGIENICFSICIKWITAKKKISYQNRFTEILEIIINVFYGARESISVIYMGQRRRKFAVDSISKPQLQNWFKESWKICLNLCSRKWLKLSRSLVINLIPLELWQFKKTISRWSDKS